MNNVTFGKTMDNLRKHSKIMFVSTDKCKNCLLSDRNRP